MAVLKSFLTAFRSCQLHQTGFTYKWEDTEWDAVLLRVIILEASDFVGLRILAEVGYGRHVSFSLFLLPTDSSDDFWQLFGWATSMKLHMQHPNNISQGSFFEKPWENNCFLGWFFSLWIIMDLAVFWRIGEWVPGCA